MSVNIEHLWSPTLEEAAPAWNMFFMNRGMVEALLKSYPEQVVNVLNRGRQVTTWQWSTTAAAVKVHEMCGVAMVAATFTPYLEAFMYSVALAAQVEPGPVELTTTQAQVSFQLAKLWTSGAAPTTETGVPPSNGNGPAESTQKLSWETVKEDLPDDLALVMQKIAKNELRIDAKAILEQLPNWTGLKERGEQNPRDPHNKEDRTLRSVQNRVLGLCRVYPVLHNALTQFDDENLLALGQQFWGLTLNAGQ
jgi:hypothetical protein